MTFYRYDSALDVVVLKTYQPVKATPRGCWIAIGDYLGTRKFILSGSGKRFAYPTEEQARNSFYLRKRRQVAILESQLANVRAAVKALEENRIGDERASRYFGLDY